MFVEKDRSNANHPDNLSCNSTSHFCFMYSESNLLQFCKHLYTLDTIFEGKCLYASAIISIKSLLRKMIFNVCIIKMSYLEISSR